MKSPRLAMTNICAAGAVVIDDCIRLSVPGIRLVRIAIEEGGRGYILGHSRGKWVVYRVFRAKGSKYWSLTNGENHTTRADAESDFNKRLVTNYMGV